MHDMKYAALWVLYLVLAFVLVSMSGTYTLTGKVFGKSLGPWPVGMDIKQPGFWVHVVVFALLVALPMVFCKK
jgi:hypothetical protein